MNKRRNFSRFYAIAKARGIDLATSKDDIVSAFTEGRTASLKEMTAAEYDEMCNCIQCGRMASESNEQYQARLRKARSAALVRMQRLGVDTADKSFAAVNKFCLDPRIAGKPFGMLSVDELTALVPKLEAMLRKPAPEKKAEASQEVPRVARPMIILPLRIDRNTMMS